MRQSKLGQMLNVTEAAYLGEFQKVKDILATEASVRQRLAQLDKQITDNQRSTVNEHSMKTVGADILWQGWVSRTRRELNIELAQVMARKLVAMDGVRHAFGRQKAVENLIEQDKKNQKRAAENRLQARLMNGN